MTCCEITLKSTYYTISESHLTYSLLVWGQNVHSIKKLMFLQNKSLRCLFKNLFKNLSLLMLSDKVFLENCVLLSKYFNHSLSVI